jgi:PilZ domain-containing protein
MQETRRIHLLSSKQVTELRKHPRLPISFPLFACGVDANGKPFKALLTVLNVSASGILVLTSSKLVPARHLQIDLPVGVVSQKARQTRREVHAEVVRVEQRPRSKLVGLKFGRRIA